jgi:hypothetical protein
LLEGLLVSPFVGLLLGELVGPLLGTVDGTAVLGDDDSITYGVPLGREVGFKLGGTDGLVDRAILGSEVGLLLGDTEGTTEVPLLGRLEGSVLGRSLRLRLGSPLDWLLGTEERFELVSSDGVLLGPPVGLNETVGGQEPVMTEGSLVGSRLGKAVGEPLGISLGIKVGK